MDIQVSRFREMLELLKPAVARKSSIKSLESVLLKDGKAIATNLETMVVIEVPEVDLTSLVPFKDVAKMLQYTPARELLQVKSKSGKLSLSWPSGSATFPVEDAGTFPDVPEFVPETEESLDIDTLIPALVSVLPYAATGDDRPVLSGITLILGDPIEVAAGDGYRMADKVLPLSFPKNVVTILPSNSVAVLKHLWEKTPRTPPPAEALVSVLMVKQHAMVAHDGKLGLRFQFANNTAAIIHLVDGKPPDWLKLVPKEEPILQVHVLAEDLEVAVHRVMGVAQDANGLIRIDFKDDTATVSAKSEGQKVETSFKTMDSSGTPNKFALNMSYLLSYLSGKQGIVTISWTGGSAPVALRSHKDPRVLIMPMAIN
ncbi:hypothetical protein ES708_17528 [subsurface metagenome]